MDIMELGAIGELVGGVAVLATLLYLALQVRQNTQSNRYLATQNLVALEAEANFLIAAHDDLAALLQKAMTGERGALAPHEQYRFNATWFGLYVQFDFAYHQYLTGQLEGNVWARIAHEIPLYLSVPSAAAWWAQDKARFSPGFVEYVDRSLDGFVPPSTLPTLGGQERPQ